MESHAAVCSAIRPLVANADDVAYFANSGVRQPSPLHPCRAETPPMPARPAAARHNSSH